MPTLGLEREVVGRDVYDRTVDRFRDAGILLPTFSELANPATIPEAIQDRLRRVDPDAADALNLFRVHWHNGSGSRERVPVPEHLVLPEELTGVPARIVILLGD